jgi:geranylgeranyl reductase family protein
MKYDVVIVGSGPAGANAALELATEDLSILVLEKDKIPRKKPCGGAMPSSVEKLVSIDLDSIIKNRVKDIRFYNKGQDKVDVSMQNESILMVDRSEFDMFLLKKAAEIAKGKLTIRDQCSLLKLEQEDTVVRSYLDNGESVTSTYLIGADGALGKTALSLSNSYRKQYAPTFDLEITTSSQYFKQHKNHMIMDYFCVESGYGWIFPKSKNRFSCGIGTWGKPLNLHKPLEKFIARYFNEDDIVSRHLKGFPIPIYKGTQNISKGRVLLAGDAASLVNPVTGEGIRFALHSGKLAAQTILKVLSSEIQVSELSNDYQQSIQEEIEQELKYKLSFEALAFHNNPELFYKKFVKLKH